MIELKEITKKYEENLCLNNVSISFPNKGIVVLYGHNGSGKTTLLNIIGGYDLNYEGTLIYNSNIINKKNAEEYRINNIGYILQENILFEDLTVLENLKKGVVGHVDDNTIDDILTKVGLLNFKNEKVNILSIGEKKRVNIARTLLKNPSILLADEITANLDIKNENIIFSILKELSKDRLVITVLHNKEKAEAIGDYLYYFNDGEIKSNYQVIEESEKAELVKSKNHKGELLTLTKYFSKGFVLKFIILFFLFLIAFTGIFVSKPALYNSADLEYKYMQSTGIDYIEYYDHRNENNECVKFDASDFKNIFPEENFLVITENKFNYSYMYKAKNFDMIHIILGKSPSHNPDDREIIINEEEANNLIKLLDTEEYSDLIGIEYDSYKIVGIFENSTNNYNFYGEKNISIVYSDDLSVNGEYNIVLVDANLTYKQYKELSDLLYKNRISIVFWNTKDAIGGFLSLFSLATIVFIIILFLFLIITVNSLYNYYYKEIILFRILGYGRYKILNAFACIIGLIFLVSILVSVIASVIIYIPMNKYIMDKIVGIDFMQYRFLRLNIIVLVLVLLSYGICYLMLLYRFRKMMKRSINTIVRAIAV